MNKFIEKLKDSFKNNSKKIFIIDSSTGKEFTYKEIENLSLKLASFLDNLEIKKNDKVAIILSNHIEFILIYFACMQVGAIPIPINHRLHLEEIKYILSDIDAKILFIESSFDEIADGVKNFAKTVFSIELKNQLNRNTFLEFVNQQPIYANESFQTIQDSDTIIIIYTSGTTKFPKGIMISYENVIKNGIIFSSLLELNSDLRFYAFLDLAYLGGFYNLMFIPFLSGCSIVLDKTFSSETALHFWSKIRKYSANALWLVPSIMAILLKLDRSDDGSEYCRQYIKKALVGTAPLTNTLRERFEERYPVSLYENYGMSETFFISTNYPKLSFNKGVGKPIPGCEVVIISQDGKICEAGQKGEIAIKTEYLMKGYYNNLKDMENRLKNGLFYTGDLGYMDTDGYLFIVGREKDIIIKGGINISPKEIEEVLAAYPSINSAVVFGIPNEYSGEEIVAVIDADVDLDERDIRSYCKNRLASFKSPESFYFTKEIPRSVTGKIQKDKIKEKIISLRATK